MRSALFILSILLFTSCSSGTDSDFNNTEPLIPLEVGSSWVFSVDYENRPSKTDTISVVKDTLIGEQIWFKLQSRNTATETILDGFYTNLDEGFSKYSPSDDNVLIFKANSSEGDSYLTEGSNIWITTYNGEEKNDRFNTSTKNYSVVYERVSDSQRTYNVDQPYEFKRAVSSDIGFITWETGYMGPLNDSTLTLKTRVNFSLEEFIQAQ